MGTEYYDSVAGKLSSSVNANISVFIAGLNIYIYKNLLFSGYLCDVLLYHKFEPCISAGSIFNFLLKQHLPYL